MVDRQLAALQALGQTASLLGDLDELDTYLAQVPSWQPAAALREQAAEARRLINGIQARMDRRLVVTLIGPSGSGKSTLLNALAGGRNLSPVGHRRPTTQEAIVLADDPQAARQLTENLEEGQIQVSPRADAGVPDHLILVDTPDTDSMARNVHEKVILALVDRSDILVCVFDAQNPKRRDHAEFMAPLVQRFHGASLIAVMNKCDRLDAVELTETVGPDFDAYLQKAWPIRPEVMLLISARSHVQHPDWDPSAQPRHDLDQFTQLHELIGSTFGQEGFMYDRRIANARRIRDYVFAQAARTARRDLPRLEQAREKMASAGKTALQEALAGLRRDHRRQIFGVNVRLYQALAQRWLGPVGWLVAIWSRLIVFGSGLAALVRFGNPIHQIWGMLSSWRRFKESREALKVLQDDSRVDQALQALQKSALVQWPDIAEHLIAGHFNPQVRRQDPGENQQIRQDLGALWADRLDAQIESTARSLSHFLLQIFFNLPSLALMAYVGWLTIQSFFRQQYLTSDFFLHALLTIALVLLLSFFLLQAVVRLALSRERIQRRAFEQVNQAVAAQPVVLSAAITAQIEKVIELADDHRAEGQD